MKIKFILPALTEAESPFWRPIKYSLFPPLGLATLAGFLNADVELVPRFDETSIEALLLHERVEEVRAVVELDHTM